MRVIDFIKYLIVVSDNPQLTLFSVLFNLYHIFPDSSELIEFLESEVY